MNYKKIYLYVISVKMDGTLPVPAQLVTEGNMSENFKKFRQKFENYLLASGASTKSDDVQRATLLHIIGDDRLDIYNTLDIKCADAEKGITVKDILTAFEKYFNPRKNEVYERYLFFNIHQESGQNINDFIVKLKTQAKQ